MSSKREMTAEVLARLFQERSQSRVIRFDESVVPRTSPDDLDEELTRRFFREDAELTEDTLHKLRIVAGDEDDIAHLTLAGVLFPVGALPSTGRSWTDALDGSARRRRTDYPRRVPTARRSPPRV